MAKKLQDYFPMIRTGQEVLDEIEGREELLAIFEEWSEERQEEFLNFCTGARGVKVLYDSFFKELFSPEYHPERIERFLSLLLDKKVRIAQILPNDSVRIADECTLLVTDIVVELEDGSLGNIEIQKIGYAFPGERMACYSSDLLLRQYKRVRARRKDKFTYRDIKTVYTIVLFEKSTEEFHAVKNQYIHRGKQRFDTGLGVNTLQEYILIPLDIFKENTHNKGIKNELDAWLTFISFDEPEKMIELIENYPEFKEMYEEVYQMCLNMERVMGMFSKELRELDRNTVQYMIEEQKKNLAEKQKEVAEKQKEVVEKQKEVVEKQKKLEEQQKQLEEQREQAEQWKRKSQEKDRKLQEESIKLQEKERENEELKKKLKLLEEERL
ncbi:PD-(D/E)XK nuclease family transposase [Faecalicatena contorta]|uniref:PD-(D/E)XK nuclease family transposase n=1 Tax=Faecalicatena contorta TaxID=39482 RepID=A0A316A177_9FIRM|nr:PD-(D/E)XK nuclease family transposase [Faecalicatena contorta]PWJ51591.1 PD-(D/E)XK nuclease-like transposase [Faecalicatena contorta]SUQ13147.1 PD-(D/E)XK nuclease family transposase [Faecalicatena contorta]